MAGAKGGEEKSGLGRGGSDLYVAYTSSYGIQRNLCSGRSNPFFHFSLKCSSSLYIHRRQKNGQDGKV